jgi:hypothetical protein
VNPYICSLADNGTDDSHDPIESNGNTVACAPVGGGEDLSSNEIQNDGANQSEQAHTSGV